MSVLLEKLKEHAKTGCGDAHETCGEAAVELTRATAEITRLQAALHGAIDYIETVGKAHPQLVLSIYGLHPIQEATARWRSALGQARS